MRININKTKNHEFVYVIKDFYNNGSRTSKIIEKLGRKSFLVGRTFRRWKKNAGINKIRKNRIKMIFMMDGDGIPLAFDLYEGNKNEQTTLKLLEERIIKES